MNDNTHAALDEVLRSAVDAGEVPGVVAMVVDRDNVLYSNSVGVMDSAGTEAMRPDAIFQIFSMTKPITSLGIMILQEEGLLSLDDPASDYLPELADREVLVSVDADNSSVKTRPASRPITIRDLLRHTSGIGYIFSSLELLEVANSCIGEPRSRGASPEHLNNPPCHTTSNTSIPAASLSLLGPSGNGYTPFGYGEIVRGKTAKDRSQSVPRLFPKFKS